jgi:hypothetical protein
LFLLTESISFLKFSFIISIMSSFNYEVPIDDGFFGEEEDEGEGMIRPTIVMGKAEKILSWDVDPSWTVKKFKERINEMELGELPESKEAKMDLSCGGVTLVDDKTLRASGINNNLCKIVVINHLNGGAQQAVQRRMDTRNPLLKGRGTRKPDCINGEDKLPRARLPCGCAFCAETMFNYIGDWFGKVYNNSDPPCPNCKIPAPWPLTACIAALTPDEFKNYSRILHNRKKAAFSLLYSNCPACEANVKRPESLSQNRVGCPLCRKYDFCFICKGKWGGGGLQVCGNKSCPMVEIQSILDNSAEATISGKENIPVWRACPKCNQVCRWQKACKHMLCPDRKNCKFEFCMVCLQNWSGHDEKLCQKKPKQKFT